MLAEKQITKGSSPAKHPLVGLLISQALGAFNDNAWKQIVVLLAISSHGHSATDSQARAAFAQVILLIPLIIFNLPGGVLADRFSKRSVLLAMKALELVLMLLATAALFAQSGRGHPGAIDTRAPGHAGRPLQPVQVRHPPRDPAPREALIGQRPDGDVDQPGDHRRHGGRSVSSSLSRKRRAWLGGAAARGASRRRA